MTCTGTTFTTISIPKDIHTSDRDALAIKFRSFKLDALKTAPKAFSAEYHTESQLPLSIWLTRISRPGMTILICVAVSEDMAKRLSKQSLTELEILLKGEWTGMFTMIGPVSRQDYIWEKSGQPEPGPEGDETRWQLTSLFTLPAYRGNGIARLLTQGVIDVGKEASSRIGMETNRAMRTRIRLVVHPNNKDVARMYEKFGFVDSARMTVAEACVANGDGDMVPTDADPTKWHSRFGIAMEYLD